MFSAWWCGVLMTPTLGCGGWGLKSISWFVCWFFAYFKSLVVNYSQMHHMKCHLINFNSSVSTQQEVQWYCWDFAGTVCIFGHRHLERDYTKHILHPHLREQCTWQQRRWSWGSSSLFWHIGTGLQHTSAGIPLPKDRCTWIHWQPTARGHLQATREKFKC